MTKKEELVWQKLEEVLDPELGIPVVDLGLIYEVKEKKEGEIYIKMTLTTFGCPLFGMIENEIREKILEIEGVRRVEIELTFDPPWSPARLSDRAKAKLGYL